jgi:hypothetical protein
MAEKSLNGAIQFFKDKAILHPGVSMELNLAIQMGLTFGKATPGNLQNLIQMISPASGIEAEKVFDRYYMKGSLEPDGRQSMDFNGGYHTLACLYAAAGDIQHVFWCFEKLLANNQHDYFELPRIFNNHLNVLEYLYQYGHRDQVPLFLDWLAKHTADNPPVTILRNAILRAGYISHMYSINLNGTNFRSNRGYVFPNLCFCDRPVFDAMDEDYTREVDKMKDPAAKKFALALNQKRMAMFYSKYWYDRQMTADEQKLDQWLSQSLVFQSQLDSLYLEGTESSTVVYNSDGVRTSDMRRYDLLNYSDYRDGWFSWTFHTDYFFNFLVRKNLLKTIYKTGKDLQLLHYWVAKSFEWKVYTTPEDYSNTYVLPDTVFKNILAFVDQHPQGAAFDRNLLYLVLANRAFEKADTVEGLKYYHDLDMKNITRSSDRYEYLEKIFFLNMVKDLAVNLASIGNTGEAFKLAAVFPTDEMRLVCYVNMADRVYNKNATPSTFIFLDSIYSSDRRIDFTNLRLDFDCRADQIRVLSKIGSRTLNENAVELLREIPQDFKFDGVIARASGIASEGNYYNARTSIPPTLTESQDLICRAVILLEDCRASERLEGNKSWKEFDKYLEWRNLYINFSPN